MINTRRSLRQFTSVFLALLVIGCSSDSTGPDAEEEGVFLRVTNAQSAAITVRVVGSDQVPEVDRLTAEFGSMAPGVTSSFRAVNESFFVYIDGELLSNGSSNRFGIDQNPTKEWTLTLKANGGWSLEAYFGD
jgi:hypothetical protein